MINGAIALAATLVPLIVHGSDDGGDPTVVAIVDSTGVVACSGTVIAPHFVLTAAHCLVPEIAHGAHVAFGSSVGAPTAWVAVAASRGHPAFDAASFAHDAALLVLATAAPVPPMTLATTAPGIGMMVQVAGWGETGIDAGDSGTKRSGTALMTGLDALTLQVAPDPAQPCIGDSGGPALATTGAVQSVVGIASHGDPACASGATYTRVDSVTSDFIAPTLASLGDGTVPAGARCMFTEQCLGDGAACLVAPDDANVSYCTSACAVNADCPQAMVCVDVGDEGSQCRYPIPTPGAPGSACTTDTDCVDGQCTTMDVCAVPCDPVDGSCPAGFSCTNTAAIDFFCIGAPPAVVGGACALGTGDRAVAFPCGICVALAVLAARRPRRRRG